MSLCLRYSHEQARPQTENSYNVLWKIIKLVWRSLSEKHPKNGWLLYKEKCFVTRWFWPIPAVAKTHSRRAVLNLVFRIRRQLKSYMDGTSQRSSLQTMSSGCWSHRWTYPKLCYLCSQPAFQQIIYFFEKKKRLKRNLRYVCKQNLVSASALSCTSGNQKLHWLQKHLTWFTLM